MTMKDEILGALDSPYNMEMLYRSDPEAFVASFQRAIAEHPNSLVLRTWRERLYFETKLKQQKKNESTSGWRWRDIGITVLISLVAGTLAKLPLFFTTLNDERFYSRTLGFIVGGSLIAYFCVQKVCRRRAIGIVAAVFFGALLYLNLLPHNYSSQTLVLSCIHMPFLLWSLLGFAFLGGVWRNLPGRMDYLRYNGEMLVHTVIILIGGVALTGLTFALFELIHVRINDWYLKNVVIYGAIASPIVATLLIDRVIGNRFRIVPLMAKVFTPLFLATTVAYLVAMIVNRRSPFTDRDFLLVFNGLLLAVLGLCVFSISSRDPEKAWGFSDFLNVGLVGVTLVIDIVALAAILFRLTSYGFSPNRLAVLGGNLVVFCHLGGIACYYVRALRKAGPFEALERWVVGYIPVYTVWSVVVAVGFPLVFWFK